MKVLLTLDFDGDSDAFEHALCDDVRRLVASRGAARAAVDVRVGGTEGEQLAELTTEPAASALVSLWQPTSVDAALQLGASAGGRLIGAYTVDEVVQRDYDRSWPEGEASPGVKLICFVRRRADLTHDAYSRHWRENHGPLAVKHQPGFWHYVQNHATQRLTDDTPDVDGIGEIHYQAIADIATGTYDSADGQRLIQEDTLRFMDHDRSTVLVSQERLIGR